MSTTLPINLVGFNSDSLKGTIGRSLKGISWPETQSSECAWRLELLWGGGQTWVVQSVPTMTDSGHEMGSLRIEKVSGSSLGENFRRSSLSFSDFTLGEVKIASASESGVISDCAIALIGIDGMRLVVATAPAPGAVALLQPGKPHPKTEFTEASFVWRPLDN